ncbi:phosphatidate cytidylyltransferase [Devriesea agamarum]|uniref:phosphatidate cytidylyltransferase n=1 Tax=Devriesea agamarum TaxID=472569 RepID=UPI00071D984D|nr:phosphatidate cytidylyltransferase [Devriesea agamarum]
MPPPPAVTPPERVRRKVSAGRDLPAAIGVGVALGAALLIGLFWWPPLFYILVVLALGLGVLEVTGALSSRGLRVPLTPVLVGSLGIAVSTLVWRAPGLVIAMAVAVAVVMIWRVVETTGLAAVRDVVAGIFTLAWVPFLGSFILLLFAQDDGAMRVLLAIAVPAANDTGGYIAGVLAGRHPMVPTISPKKSWEGFVGSLICGTTTAAVIVTEGLGGPWWAGLIIGPVMVVIATVGDLCESLLKRDLGLKDMGSLLPGHGGVLDRIDSMLLSAPTAFLLLGVLLI